MNEKALSLRQNILLALEDIECYIYFNEEKDFKGCLTRLEYALKQARKGVQ